MRCQKQGSREGSSSGVTSYLKPAVLVRGAAFPAGVIFAGHAAIRQKNGPETQRNSASGEARFRKMYSPKVYDDPYADDQWRKEVEAVEAQCRDAREHCAEAKAARRWLSEKR